MSGFGIMTVAWRDFLLYAIQDKAIRDAFVGCTGLAWPNPPANGLDAMIDQATGHTTSKVTLDYAYWVTLTQWGTDGVPVEFLAEAKARFPEVVGLDGAPIDA